MRPTVLLLCVVVCGCGGDRSTAPPAIGAVKTCLEGKGLKVLGGAGELSEDDSDAPDRGELIVGGAFIAFYSSEELADELEGGVRENTERAGGTVERMGTVTVVYVNTKSKDEITSCLER